MPSSASSGCTDALCPGTDTTAETWWCWTNAMTPGADRGRAWLDAIEKVSGSSTVAHFLPSEFGAVIAVRKRDRLRVSDIVSDAFEGQNRTKSLTPRDQFFSVQLMEFGEKWLSSDGESVLQRPGDVIINFDLTRCDFEVREPSRVITVVMPLSRWKTWLPTSVRRSRHKLPADSPCAQLLTSNFKSMSSAFLGGVLNDGRALTEAMIGLLVAALGDEDRDITHLARIKGYIQDNLDDIDLSPARIAAGVHISVRHLHTLFEAEAMTVQQYVIFQRLLQSKRDLGNLFMEDRTIGEIAYGCGFQSVNHFSRRFKEEFGVTPRQYRVMHSERPA